MLLNLGRLRESPDERDALLDGAIDELAAGLEDIRQLAGGLHPALLSERGLAAALEALVLRAPVSVELAALPGRRYPEPVEATAYYVVAEALANVQKHARAAQVVVRVRSSGSSSSSKSSTTASAEPTQRAAACGASQTASRRAAGG